LSKSIEIIEQNKIVEVQQTVTPDMPEIHMDMTGMMNIRTGQDKADLA
jgi:hypothetical protein